MPEPSPTEGGGGTTAPPPPIAPPPAPPPPPAPAPPPPTSPPATGGTTASNGAYAITTQRQAVQVLASGAVVDVEIVGITTIPYNVYAEVIVPLSDWQSGNTAAYANPVAAMIVYLMENFPITTASFVQDVDPATNLLTSFEDFTVSYQPGGLQPAMTAHARVAISALPDGTTAPAAVQAAYASLQNTAGL